MITKNRRFPRKVDINVIMSDKRFMKKRFCEHENRHFPRKDDIKGIMCEKYFF